MKRTGWIWGVGLGVACLMGDGTAQAGLPSGDEQYWLELINRMRINPRAELGILTNINPGSPATWSNPKSDDPNIADALNYFNVDANTLQTQWNALTPVAPLAWNSNLHTAASGHNDQMIAYDLQTHETPEEPGLGDRLTAAGYQFAFAGENVYAYAETIIYGHAGFVIDWGTGPGGIQSPAGHRDNIMSSQFREVGIAITPENNPGTEVGPLVVTQDFGRRLNSGNAFVTGVLYTDALEADDFYTQGEGLGGVTIQAYKNGNTLSASTTTYPSGGYSLQLASGTYDIKMSGGGLAGEITYKGVVFGSNNIKLDNRTKWIGLAGNSWNSAGNWYAGVPNGPGTVAILRGGSAQSISISTAITVGELNLENPAGYTLAGTANVTFQGSGSSAINVISGNHTIGAPLLNAVNTQVNIAAGSSLAFNGPLTITGTLTRVGGGTLNLSSIAVGSASGNLVMLGGLSEVNGQKAVVNGVSIVNAGTALNLNADLKSESIIIDQGTLKMNPRGSGLIYTKALSIGSGKLDLTDNDLVLESTSENRDAALASVTALVKSARNSAAGRWNGDGITSSLAAANPDTGLIPVINDNGNGNPLISSLGGEILGINHIVVKYSWNGDVNIDGRINADDYFRIDQGFLARLPDPTYRDGDFNFDLKVNADDYFLIDQAFLNQKSTLAMAVVPEPGLSVLGLVSMAFLRGRRRR